MENDRPVHSVASLQDCTTNCSAARQSTVMKAEALSQHRRLIPLPLSTRRNTTPLSHPPSSWTLYVTHLLINATSGPHSTALRQM